MQTIDITSLIELACPSDDSREDQGVEAATAFSLTVPSAVPTSFAFNSHSHPGYPRLSPSLDNWAWQCGRFMEIRSLAQLIWINAIYTYPTHVFCSSLNHSMNHGSNFIPMTGCEYSAVTSSRQVPVASGLFVPIPSDQQQRFDQGLRGRPVVKRAI